MFINAEPRSVSNGFETFVPTHRVESLHQRLIEMTNNDINAWRVYRPVAASASGSWSQQMDEFGNENNSVQNPCGEYFQQAPLAVPRQLVNYSKTSLVYPNQAQCQLSTKSTMSEQPHSCSAPEMDCLQKQSPILGHDYQQWILGCEDGSFAEFSRMRNMLKDFPCQTPIESNLATCTPSFSSQSLQPSYQEEKLTLGANFSVERTSPSTAYSSYSPLNASADPMSLVADLDSGQMSTIKMGWWRESLRDNRDQYQGPGEMPWSYDGLPKCQAQQQQQYCGLWNTDNQGVDDWIAHAIASSTISPNLLTLNDSSASSTSSSSSSGGMAGLYRSSTVASSSEDLSERPGRENLDVVEPQPHSQRKCQIIPGPGPTTLAVVEPHPCPPRQRQVLPNSGPIHRRSVPVLPSNDFTASKNTKRATKFIKSGNNTRRKASPAPISTPVTKQTSSQRAETPPSRPSEPKRIEPKPASPASQQPWYNVSQSSATTQAIHHRDAKDDFLVRSKLAGMSYKEIRRQGRFSEAESTLRGRFRTLTKHKNARVRKPEWDDNDVRLLKKAVRKLTHNSDPTKSKVPWKQVAEYIANNGGSYHFGNATCRKRWDELQASSGY